MRAGDYRAGASPAVGGFLSTTLGVAARVVLFVALLVVPTVVGSVAAPEGTSAYAVCRALPSSMCCGLLYGTFLFLAGKVVSAASGGRVGGIPMDLAFVVCAVGGFAYAMLSA